MADALASVGKLAGVETTIGAPDTAEILDFRFPHHVGRRIERPQLVGPPLVETTERAHGAAHDVAGQSGHAFHPRNGVGPVERTIVHLPLLEIRPVKTSLNILPLIALERIGRAPANGLVKPAGSVIVSPVRPGHEIVIVHGVHVHRQGQLFVVADAGGPARLFLRVGQRRQ